MVVLAMTSALSNKEPAIALKFPNHVPDLHDLPTVARVCAFDQTAQTLIVSDAKYRNI
jgi:hypothetical protein